MGKRTGSYYLTEGAYVKIYFWSPHISRWFNATSMMPLWIHIVVYINMYEYAKSNVFMIIRQIKIWVEIQSTNFDTLQRAVAENRSVEYVAYYINDLPLAIQIQLRIRCVVIPPLVITLLHFLAHSTAVDINHCVNIMMTTRQTCLLNLEYNVETVRGTDPWYSTWKTYNLSLSHAHDFSANMEVCGYTILVIWSMLSFLFFTVKPLV